MVNIVRPILRVKAALNIAIIEYRQRKRVEERPRLKAPYTDVAAAMVQTA